MKPSSIKLFSLGLDVAASVVTSVNASVIYIWVPFSAPGPTSGQLTYNGPGSVSPFAFTDADGAVTSFFGTTQILGDGDMVLTGMSPITSGPYAGLDLTWQPDKFVPAVEQLVYGATSATGDWKVKPSPVVPEPDTIISAALMLLPLGVSTLRVIRKKSAA
jgi:hypothetical protein